MANINLLSTDKNNFSSMNKGVSFAANGSKINLFVPTNFRVFFEQGNPSLFPKTASGDYSGGGVVVIDLQNGTVTGSDEASSDFTAVIPSAGNYVAISFALNLSSELVVFNGSFDTLENVRNGVLSSSSAYLGVQPLNTTKLFSVIVNSQDGSTLSNISDDLIFSYLNFLNFNIAANRVNFTALGNSAEVGDISTTRTIIREPFLTDVFSGSDRYQTSRTSVRVGDTLEIERTLNNQVSKTTVTVTNVTKGLLNDTVEFAPSLTVPHILELRPVAKVVNPTVNNLLLGLYQKNRRMVFDSGWIPVSLDSSGTFSTSTYTWVSDPINLKPLIVWSSIKNSTNAIVLNDSFRSDGGRRIGVQVTIGASFVKYEIAPSGVFYNIDIAQLVTDGFIRIFLREV